MSSRRSSFALFVALVGGGMVACSGAFAIAACSSSSDDTGSGDAGKDAPTDTRRGDAPIDDIDSSKQTAAQCRAKCKAEHPNAVPKEDAIDECWAANCTDPCIDQTSDFDAGDDAGDAGGPGLLCGTTVPSGVNSACDRCTQAFCCTSWQACFEDPDCEAYDKCYGACGL